MANKVKFGLKNAHYAPETDTGYSEPVVLPGAVNLTLSPKGEKAEFYADDIPYFTQEANQGYEGELEIADIPVSFMTDCLGFTVDTNGAVIELNTAKQKSFAFMFEVDGDEKPRRFAFYSCMAARPNVNASTKEKQAEPKTDTLSFTVSPRASDGAVKASLVKSVTNSAIYDAFFSSVYEKDDTV